MLAEDAGCPYIFVTSKELLGQASSTKRPTSCVMMCPADVAQNPKMSKKAKEVLEKAGKDEEKGKDLKEYSQFAFFCVYVQKGTADVVLSRGHLCGTVHRAAGSRAYLTTFQNNRRTAC